jgi:3-phytase
MTNAPTVVRSLLALLLPLLGACATAPHGVADTTPAQVEISETWVSAEHPEDELDSLAAWPAPDGRLWLLASAKRSHRLVVFDAQDGRRLREFGSQGSALGQFDRPNGVAVAGNLLLVVERENRRVQVLHLPDLVPLASFGQAQLRAPYGLWVYPDGADASIVLVTDSFLEDPATLTLPPREQLAERVKRYRIARRDEQLQVQYLGAFGDLGEGALHMVESIAGDLAHGRLLIAEEDRRIGSTLREYTLDGHYLGRSLPAFDADAEGVALWECGAGGYWLAAEQVRPTRFHLLARRDLAPVARFHGRKTALTDGIALYPAPSPGFPHGALFALDEDRAVAAFDLGQVTRILGLAAGCAQ